MNLIKNAHIITMESQDFQSGYIITEGGLITAIGNMADLHKNEGDFSEVYDACGAYALPGFIDAHCHIGLWEEGAGAEGDDGNEEGEVILPQLRAIDGINHEDIAFKEALASGVTTVVTGPGSAGIIGGQFAALKTVGRYVDEMLVKAPVALKAALGENPKKCFGNADKLPSSRMTTAALLREALFSAKEYVKKQEAYKFNKDLEKPEADFKNDILAQVIRRELPLKIHVHRADDICTALRIAEEFDLRITLEHCTEGHLLLPLLREKNVPLLLGPVISTRTKPELKNKSMSIFKDLGKDDLPFAIITDHPEQPIDTLYLSAALANRAGLDKKQALAAITINAAKCVDLENRIGSLAIGKDADIVIQSGELFTLDAKTKAVFVNGVLAFSAKK